MPGDSSCHCTKGSRGSAEPDDNASPHGPGPGALGEASGGPLPPPRLQPLSHCSWGELAHSCAELRPGPGDKDSSPIALKLNGEVIPGNVGSGLGKETGREGSAVGHGGSADPWERPGLYTGWGCPRAAAGGRR